MKRAAKSPQPVDERESLRRENRRRQEELDEVKIPLQNTIEDQLADRTVEIEREKMKADDRLLNILPAQTAEKLKTRGNCPAHFYEQVTVLFTDCEGFTRMSEQLTPQRLVSERDFCFRARQGRGEKQKRDRHVFRLLTTPARPGHKIGLPFALNARLSFS